MNPSKSISVALPAYNEEANIEKMLRDVLEVLPKYFQDFEVIVVDDGSRDGTADVVAALAERHERLRLIRHPRNRGYGAAVWSGLTSAQKDLLFFTDSDRQFDLQEIRKLLEAADESDLVIGFRSPRRDPLMRKLNGWGWSLLVTVLFGYTARDIDCAFKLLRRSVIDRLRDRVHSRGATFSAELLVRAKNAGFRIREVALRGHRPRTAGSPTGARPAVILRAFRELIALRLAIWREGRAG